MGDDHDLDVSMVAGLDKRVAHVETGLATALTTLDAQGARVGRLEEEVKLGFSQVMERLNRPTNVWGVASIGVVLIVAAISGINVYTNQEFSSAYREIDLRFDHVNKSIAEINTNMEHDNVKEQENSYAMGRRDMLDEFLTERVRDLTAFQKEAHFEIGVLSTASEENKQKLVHFDEMGHWRDDRMNMLDEKAAAAEVSRRAIGDYTKEHNQNHRGSE